MDQLQLTAQQCEVLHAAMKHYHAHVNQPNEMAVDNTAQRQAVQTLLQYMEDNTALGMKTYKMVNGDWVLQN